MEQNLHSLEIKHVLLRKMMIDEMMSHEIMVWQSRKMHALRALSISRT